MNRVLTLIFRREWRRYGVLAGLAALAAACSVPAPSLVGVPVARTGEYIIGPGDDLNVFVYRSPELSAVVPVRPDGLISTPLAPDVVAVGRTPTQLAHALEARLSKFVKQPTVTVMMTGFLGPPDRQVRIIGEVVQPMALPYRRDLSVLDVMIEAKGLTPFAAGNRALIVRREPGGPKTFNVRLADLLKYGEISQNVPMRPGDIVFVPQAWF